MSRRIRKFFGASSEKLKVRDPSLPIARPKIVVLADADAWLIARYMKTHPSGASLSDAMLDVFKRSETNRIKRFYQERFAANADNVVSVFQKLADGIDIWVFENFDYGKEKLLSASGASRLPDRRESETLARAYAAFLDSPHR